MPGLSLNANAAAWTPGGVTEEAEEEWERVDVTAEPALKKDEEEVNRRRQQAESILEAEGTWGDDDEDDEPEPVREPVVEDPPVVVEDPPVVVEDPPVVVADPPVVEEEEPVAEPAVVVEEPRYQPREYKPRGQQQQYGGGRYGGFPRSNSNHQFEEEGRPRRNNSGSNLQQQHHHQNGEAKTYQKPAWARRGDDSSEVLRKATSILNKLTLEKFDRLSAEFVGLDLRSVELVAGAIDLIVDKAQRETHFVDIYAELCVKLAATPLAGLGETEKGKKFRRLLLERCQAEFERDDTAAIAEIEAIPDKAEREQRVNALRKLYIGHMYFIGALYKQELLRETIMHHCIQELFGDPEEPDDEKIECLSKLLTTIGKQLDAAALEKKESQKFMKAYFKHLNRLTKSEKLAVRIRFLVRDLCELRDNDWKPRREIEKAKTIAEIHEDVQREADEKAGKKPAPKKDAKEPRAVADDGWETVGSAKFVPVKQQNHKGSAAAPPSAFGAFASLSSGGKSEKKKKKKTSSSKEDDSSSSGKKHDKKSSAAKAAKPDKETKPPKLDKAAYKAKAKVAIDEYVSIEQIDEVVCCVVDELDKMAGPSARWLLVSQALDVMLNCKERDRAKLPPLLLDLASKKLLDAAALSDGFRDVLAHLPDILIDMPKAKNWLGDLLKDLVAAQALDLAFLATPPKLPPDDPDDLLAAWTDFKTYVEAA